MPSVRKRTSVYGRRSSTYVRARSLAAALTLGAGVALSAVATAVPSATAQDLEWATSAGGTSDDVSSGIALDAAGNSYVTGLFQGVATFGAGEDNETSLTSAGFGDIFVAKYDPDGALLWATRAGGGGNSTGLGIDVDAEGNIHVTGWFRETAVFGEGEDNETTLTSAGGAPTDIFVAKYDPDGALLWATRAGGSDTDLAVGIAVDADGNSHVAGVLSGMATFGAGEDNETTLTSAGSGDIFVAKYDPDGALIWATRAGSPGGDQGFGIAVDTEGSSHITGGFSGFSEPAVFGEGEANETELFTAGGTDSFVAKYDPDGALLWAVRAGRHGDGLGIAVDGDGNSHVTGGFSDTAVFGDGEDNETTFISAGSFDSFVAKYDRDGASLWAVRAGGTSVDEGSGIALDAAGNSLVTGRFAGAAVFGEGEDNETTLTSAGGAPTDIFVAKYDPDGALLWAVRAGGTSVDRGSGIALGGAGDSHVTGLFRETAVFGAGEDNETTLTSAGGAPTDIFVAKYGAGADLDGDGVPDVEDFCPDTQLPEAVPTSGQLLAGRFAIIDQGPEFSTGRARPDADTFTIFDTAGCSCEQIIDLMGLGAGHSRFGCSLGAMRTFIKELPE